MNALRRLWRYLWDADIGPVTEAGIARIAKFTAAENRKDRRAA